MATSAASFGTGMPLASGAPPVPTVMKPPALDDAVERAAVDDRSLIDGERPWRATARA